MAKEALEGPRERVRRRLVPRDQQGEHLVADLAIGHEAVLVRLGAGERGKDVGADLGAAVVPTQADLVEQDPVDLAGHAHHLAERRAAAHLALELRHQRQRVLGDLQHLGNEAADLRVPLGGADADHDPGDRLRRDPPHRLLQLERGAGRPRGHLAGCDLADQVAVCADALAMEGRGHQPAVMLVLVTVEKEEGALTEHRAEDRVRRAHPERRGVPREDLPRGLRVGDEGASLEGAKAHGEDRPVAAAVALHELDRIAEPAAHLPEAGCGGAVRQRLGGRGECGSGLFVGRQGTEGSPTGSTKEQAIRPRNE